MSATNTVTEFYCHLLTLGVVLSAEDNNLQIQAPKGVINQELKEQLVRHKADLLALIRGEEGIYPATEGQKRLWFIQQHAASDAYHIAVGLKISGRLDSDRLCDVINQEIACHPAFRVRLIETDEGLMQQIGETVSPVAIENHKSGSESDWLNSLAEPEFNLSSDAPIRIQLIKTSETEHLLLLVVHHTAADGWSLGVFLEGVSRRYQGEGVERNDVAVPLPDLSTKDAEVWWSELLSEAPEPIKFKPTVPNARPLKSQIVWLDEQQWREINLLANQTGISVQHWLNACFNIALGKLYQRNDVVLKTPYVNRKSSREHKMVGFLANTLFSRCQLCATKTARQLAEELSQQSQQGIGYSHAAYSQLVQQHPDSASDIMFSYESDVADFFKIQGASVEPIRYQAKQAKFDLMLTIQTGNSANAVFEYDSKVLNFSEVERIKRSFISVVEQVVDQSNIALGEIALSLPPSNLDVLPQPEPAISYIHQQVLQQPQSIAAIQGDIQWTYEQLWAKVGSVHHWLRQQGIAPGARVAVSMNAGLEWLASALGIWSVGAAYVPIDNKLPFARQEMMLDEANIDLKIDQSNFPTGECENSWQIINSKPSDPAWLIFTSGSTGKPKASVVHHGGVSRLLGWYYETCMTSHCRALVISNPAFDLTQKNLFAPLIAGGVVAFPSMGPFDARVVLDTIQEHRATLVNCTPTVFQALLKEAHDSKYRELDSLTHVVLGGESISLQPLQQWQQIRPTQCSFINSYGPTECSDVVAWYPLSSVLTEESEPVAIGKAVPGTRLLVVDQHGQPLPAGAEGELLIDGDSVGLGYLNQESLTEKVFIAGGGGLNRTRYLTGDRAIVDDKGVCYYLGRRDNQIKLNGYRIETGEVELALMASGLVDNCSVVIRQDASQHSVLVAFYSSANGEVSEAVLRHSLVSSLPDYAIPSRFVLLDLMPTTPSGKIDRNALPSSLPNRLAAIENTSDDRLHWSDTEQEIAKVWSALLGLPVKSRHDDFFALGGSSLLAMDMVRQVGRVLNLPVRTTQLMSSPKLADFALAIETTKKASPINSPSNVEQFALNPLSAMQKRLWFLWRKEGASSDYLMSATWRLDGELDVERLVSSIERVFYRHPLVVSHLVENGLEACYQRKADEPLVQMERYDLNESQFLAFQRDYYTTPIDLGRERFSRLALVKTQEKRHYLLVNLHHIAADGLSLPIFFTELQEAWKGNAFTEEAPQFSHIAQRAKDSYPELRQLWHGVLAGAPQTSMFPADRQKLISEESESAGVQRLSLPRETWQQLKKRAKEWKVSPFSVLLTSWGVLLHKYSQQEDLVIGVPVALRDDPESARVIGPLLNTVPVRLSVSREIQVSEAVIRGASAFRQSQSGADLPFEDIVDSVNPVRDSLIPPLFQIQIVEEPGHLNTLTLDGLDVSFCDFMAQKPKYDLNVHLQTDSDDFSGYIAFKPSVYGADTIQWMEVSWKSLIGEMITNPHKPLGSLSLVSEMDFPAVQQLSQSVVEQYTTDHTLHGLFEQQVTRTPEAPALLWDGGSISYLRLDRWANQIAHGLRNKGLKPGNRVCINMPSSAKRVALMFGVLKAGGVYVPIDPSWPEHRQQLIRKCSDSDMFIGADDVAALAQGQPEQAVSVTVCAEHDCYLMYTSGSTGTPKGVPIKHGGVTHDLQYLIDRFDLCEQHKVIQLTSFSFDPSVRDLFATLGSGACAVLVDEISAKTPSQILKIMARFKVSHVLSMVPTLLRALLLEESETLCLEALMLNGERLRGDDLTGAKRLFGSDVVIVNQYGPTEATMTSATHIAVLEDNSALTVPLGRPNPNTMILIMDESGAVLPPGSSGEICIAGPGLSEGYLNQASDAFVWRTLPNGQVMRFYRSGDIGRWRNDGVLTFLGRKDFQIKLRGNRIELGEIDASFGRLSGVKNAAVSVVEHLEHPILVAWIEETAAGTFDADNAKQQLQKSLPAYMVPTVFTVLSDLPLTPSGKVDRRRLPDTIQTARIEKKTADSELEKELTSVWQTLLGLSSPPDCETNFFELGANSLMMIQASERISQRVSTNVAVVDLFEYPNIRALSRYIERGLSTNPALDSPLSQRRKSRRRDALVSTGSKRKGLKKRNLIDEL
ncbi:amino acid adenylation domain-containing protein [Vibrio vulnificus]